MGLWVFSRRAYGRSYAILFTLDSPDEENENSEHFEHLWRVLFGNTISSHAKYAQFTMQKRSVCKIFISLCKCVRHLTKHVDVVGNGAVPPALLLLRSLFSFSPTIGVFVCLSR